MTSTNSVLTAIYAYPNNGYAPAKELTVGETYVVKAVDMGSFFTYIFLEGLEHGFNSVQFDFFENGKPVDIYSYSNYNSFV
jgi:hypothetical protein